MPTAVKPEIIGNKTPERKLPAGINWYLLNMAHNGRHIHDVLPKDDIPANLSNGWVVRSDIEVLKHIQTAAFLLQPDEVVWPWGDNFRAEQQMKAWKRELGGEVVHILVSDPAQKDTPWIAQSIRRDELIGLTPDSLVILYNAAKTDAERLRYRVAVIARTGQAPEKVEKN
jgi:hypothetical protein